ncbi:tyrosine-type recombinase/integrase [Sphingomonas elodea]|uniref:tyrosine-type recombinase/integrase n=1 Tax=Sphingomonas elodea TaxID=179878 RepID=UPI0002630DDA|nr:integrase arm-type DNA-binding domain-containing protein [Sphingomonas elodea]
MLTDAAVRRIKPRDKAFKTQDMHGMYLLVQPGGGRYWRWDYRHDGKRGTVALGVYPNVPLKEARERRENARKLLEKGITSSYGKLTRGVGGISAGDTFATVADEWLKKIEAEGRAAKTLEKLRWLIAFANPLIGTRPIGDISAPELLTVLRTMEVRGRYETARRLRSTCSSVIRYAIATGRAQRDVAADLQGSLITPKIKHHAAIIELARSARSYAPLTARRGSHRLPWRFGSPHTSLCVRANCALLRGQSSTFQRRSGPSPARR